MSFATYGPARTARPATTLGPRIVTAPVAAPSTSNASRYRDAELASATPGQLIVMLFDKMLLTLRRAKLACETQNIEDRCALLVKASEMVTELRGSLDFDQGGDIARQLDALYAYMLREMLLASRSADIAKIESVVHVATDLRDAFGQVVAGGAAVPQARSA
jgi:flagellar protein FliS